MSLARVLLLRTTGGHGGMTSSFSLACCALVAGNGRARNTQGQGSWREWVHSGKGFIAGLIGHAPCAGSGRARRHDIFVFSRTLGAHGGKTGKRKYTNRDSGNARATQTCNIKAHSGNEFIAGVICSCLSLYTLTPKMARTKRLGFAFSKV